MTEWNEAGEARTQAEMSISIVEEKMLMLGRQGAFNFHCDHTMDLYRLAKGLGMEDSFVEAVSEVVAELTQMIIDERA